jgi:hypothetical protein
MLLLGAKKNEGWLHSRWQLTWGTGWDPICKGACRLYADLEDPEVFVDGEKQPPFEEREKILDIPEHGDLMIRGLSRTLEVPVMISFRNQTNLVGLTLPATEKLCDSTDYETFNRALAPYVDSLELAMFC